MLVAALLSAFLAATAHAQEPGRTYRVDMLHSNRLALETARSDMLPPLAQSGFIEGRNLTLDLRSGPADQLPGLARDLATRSDVIVTPGGFLSLIAAGAATRAVPIVSLGGDPTARGLAQSLSRPGGNVTGIAIIAGSTELKRVELLHEAVPAARRIAVLTRRVGLAAGEDREDLMRAMANVGVEVRVFTADGPEEYPAAFAAMREAGMEALLLDNNGQFFADNAQLQVLAMEARLPTACDSADLARAGCLLSYGANWSALRVRLADYVVRILRGAAPAEMPIERATQFELAVNLRTARALGLTLPQTIMVRADEVIE